MGLSTLFQDLAHNKAILFAGFWMAFVSSGASKANALIFAYLVKNKGLSRQEAAWPFNLGGAVTIVGAPLVSYISTRWPIRWISLTGVIISSSGRVACYFNTSLYYLIIFHGIVRSIGGILASQMTVAIVTNSFEKNRGLAMALFTSAFPIGVFVFIPVAKLVFEEYGLNGTFLILGAMGLNACAGSLILGRYQDQFREKNSSKALKVTPMSDRHPNSVASPNKTETEEIILVKSDNIQQNPDSLRPENIIPLLERYEKEHALERNTKISDTCKESMLPKTEILKVTTNSQGKHDAEFSKENGVKMVKTYKNSPTGFVFNRRVLKKILTCRVFYLVTFTKISNVYLKSFFKLVIVDYLKDKGIGIGQGIYMMTAYSSGEFVGRLVLGALSDRGYISRQAFVVITMVVTSIIFITLTFVNSFAFLMGLAAVLGMFQGTVGPSTMVLFADYLRKEEIHIALSFSRSFTGIFSLSRAPLLGLFRDRMGSYDNLFYLLSGIGILDSIVWFAEVMYRRKINNRTTIEEFPNCNI